MAKPAIGGVSVRRCRGCAGKSSAPWAVMGMASQKSQLALPGCVVAVGRAREPQAAQGTLVLAGVAVRIYQPGILHVDSQVFAAEWSLARWRLRLTLFRQVCIALSATHFNL